MAEPGGQLAKRRRIWGPVAALTAGTALLVGLACVVVGLRARSGPQPLGAMAGTPRPNSAATAAPQPDRQAVAGGDRDRKTAQALLAKAGQEIAASADQLNREHREHIVDILLARFSILESRNDPQNALARARAIGNPFCASLALGGIAATEIPSAPSESAGHYREALARAATITQWNGDHATSLGFLFQLPPAYPGKEAAVLLASSRETLDAWKASEYQKEAALLALSRATVLVAPEKTEGLLFEVALKSNHYWDSTEYLGAALARQSLERTLALAERHYLARKDWPNDQYFMRAVLLELAKADFPRALRGIKAMRELDAEIAAVKLAGTMLTAKRDQEAREVIRYLDTLNSSFNWTKESLGRLHEQLKTAEKMGPVSPARISEPVADFLRDADEIRLRSIADLECIAFGGLEQMRAFVLKALPLAESMTDSGYPHHGSPRSTALGLLVICAASLGDPQQALGVSGKIKIPELRINYLLDACERADPLPAPVEDWPIRIRRRVKISVRGGGAPG